MYQTRQNFSADSESLQADVMRFMAIIAFCLIAILALVRNVEPAELPVAETPPAKAAPATEAVIQPAPQPAATPSVPWQSSASLEPAVAAVPEAVPVPVPSHAVEPAQPAAPEPAPVTATATAPAADAISAQPTRDAEEGLILRFASDGDFLRLVAKGDIRVYAFQATDVLTLNLSYRFLDSQSPGQVYELLPPSIPRMIVEALKEARTNIDGYHWGIALPGYISQQIEQHLGRVSRGQLVIDRYGDVRHVAAS